jgi:hypothetical protein
LRQDLGQISSADYNSSGKFIKTKRLEVNVRNNSQVAAVKAALKDLAEQYGIELNVRLFL